MRLYHFLSTKDALDDVRRARIKLSEIDKLNDPFELWCADQSNQVLRAAFRKWKTKMARAHGLLCFSEDWKNPLLWSHYADRHKGICLGFDVKDDCARHVDYIVDRQPITPPFDNATGLKLLFSKYKGWEYEEEWRCWFNLEDKDSSGMFFYNFDEDIQLREIIAGPLCSISKSEINNAIAGYNYKIKLVKARLAFGSFDVIRDRRGLR